MAAKSVRYTPEFKRQMVDLSRSGRTARSLSQEYGPTPWTIALWVKQAKRDAGKGDGGLPRRGLLFDRLPCIRASTTKPSASMIVPGCFRGATRPALGPRFTWRRRWAWAQRPSSP